MKFKTKKKKAKTLPINLILSQIWNGVINIFVNQQLVKKENVLKNKGSYSCPQHIKMDWFLYDRTTFEHVLNNVMSSTLNNVSSFYTVISYVIYTQGWFIPHTAMTLQIANCVIFRLVRYKVGLQNPMS